MTLVEYYYNYYYYVLDMIIFDRAVQQQPHTHPNTKQGLNDES